MDNVLEKTEKQAAAQESERIVSERGEEQDAVAEAERIVGEGEGGISDEAMNAIQPGKVSPTDIDFILILGVAFISDVLIDPLLGLLGLPTIVLPVINALFDFLILLIIGGWMYSRSKNVVMPEKLANQLRTMEKKIAAKIEAKIRNKVAKKALKRVLLRTGAAFGIEMIPGANIFTSWVAAVLSMLG
jgi:hypothetical protein